MSRLRRGDLFPAFGTRDVEPLLGRESLRLSDGARRAREGLPIGTPRTRPTSSGVLVFIFFIASLGVAQEPTAPAQKRSHTRMAAPAALTQKAGAGHGRPLQIRGPFVTQITVMSAMVHWVTNQSADSQVEYGQSSSYGQQTAVDPRHTIFHSVALRGLSCLILYHFRVRSKDAFGSVVQSRDRTFKTGNPGPSIVSVSGSQLVVQKRNPDGSLAPGIPFIIRGVNWSPAGKDTNTSKDDPNNTSIRRPEFGKWFRKDIPLLTAMNVNTVRIFMDPGFDALLGPIGRAILDEFYHNNIMVIITVDDSVNNEQRISGAVKYYMDHPAILMWSLGSEWNINGYFGVASSVLDAAQRTEAAAQLIKALDDKHPVATSYGEIDINTAGLQLEDTRTYVNDVAPSVDVWGLNVYRGDNFGTLFQQWKSIASKPMFLGEFGIDAFHSTAQTNPPPGYVDEPEQADWDLSLWNDVFRNLSARDPERVALGGTVFEWCDEWWKVPPYDSQDSGGWVSSAFPDGMGNEEYFGIVDIDREKRQAYETLRIAFDPDYEPGPQTIMFRALSAGASAPDTASLYGFAEFDKSHTELFYRTGGGGGGRGFNVAAVDPANGDLLTYPIRNFDTWGSRDTGDAMRQMIDFLNGLPQGALVMLAVADDAGLNSYDSCNLLSYAWVEEGLEALEALGSQHVRNYCYRDSWALVAAKGEGQARDEQLGKAVNASAQATVTVP